MVKLKMLQTWNKCSGLLDNKDCPYKARFINDKKQYTCNMHLVNLNIKNHKRVKNEKKLVSWIMSLCDICTNAGEVTIFDCHKHKYCSNCYDEIKKHTNCPICLSIAEHVSK